MNNVQQSNPFVLLPKTEPGIMVYELISTDNINWEFMFFIKEETKYINKYMIRPVVELRLGLIKQNNVWIVPMMILFNNDFDMLYETLFNYHAEKRNEYLTTFSKQDRIVLTFCNEQNNNARYVSINNSTKIQEDIVEINWRLANTKPWSMRDFDIAKQNFYKKYSSPLILWNSLQKLKFDF